MDRGRFAYTQEAIWQNLGKASMKKKEDQVARIGVMGGGVR